MGGPHAIQPGAERSSLYLDTSVQSVDKPAAAAELYKRLGRLGKGHERALEMARFVQERDSRRSERLRSCAAWLAFRKYLSRPEEGWKLSAGMFCCQHLLCPVCAQLRAGRTARKYLERVHEVMKAYYTARMSMLTITVRNGPDLKERFEHLMRSVGTWLKKSRHARNGKRDKTEFSRFFGGVLSVEVKRGTRSQQWHPHIHAIVIHDQKVNVAELRAEWRKITGDSLNVDLQNLRGFKHGSKFDPVACAGDFCEVFKYAAKFSEMSLEDNWDAFGVLGGKRLLRPWGVLWGVKVPEDLTDEGLTDDLPYVEKIFRYSNRFKNYVRK